MGVMNKNFIPLSTPSLKGGNEWKYVKECLDTEWVSSVGQYVNEFENKMAASLGAKHAVAVVNGTAALHISLLLQGVSEGDEVIVPTLTFIAPVNAIRYVGAEPVFMDCDDHLNIDIEKTSEFIKDECEYRRGKVINRKSGRIVRGIIPVHIFGHPVDLAPLIELARRYNLFIIEDATESLGAFYRNGALKAKKAGTIGDIGCLSFNGNKIITTGGGGMLVTDKRALAEKARDLTAPAQDDEAKYIHNEIGYNYRLTNVLSALGVAQLEQLEQYVAIKRENFSAYNQAVADIRGLRMLEEPAYGASNYWFYSLVVEEKKYGRTNLELMAAFARAGIQTRPIWNLNHLQKPYKNCQRYKIARAVQFHRMILNLPCSVNLSQEDISRVVKVIKENAN